MLAESSCVVGAVERRLVERVRVPVDLVDCFGACGQRSQISGIPLIISEDDPDATHSEQETSS